ncbi:AIM24 family protein [Skermania sp. ID1734]|uniref:AIM24 family protein n=1 Tax=Skermania sp. ID1734 TaxID=2597516 RepID=UPI00117F015D|nr:AIM24 family protein [Skermania sp. ID1734]TSD94274.1 AIM24 family protein [Skermania sp. ID1734]
MTTASYTCRYCRQPSDASALSCPCCGAPVDVRAAVSNSGWTKQPPVKDMARIQFGQSHVQIVGKQVPVAEFALAGNDWIYFSHSDLLWCEPTARLQAMGLGGAWKRMRAGLPIVMMQAAGPGRLGLADNDAGEIVALPLNSSQSVAVREHRLLVATGSVSYDWQRSQIWYETIDGDESETHYPLGYIEDRFHAPTVPGLLLLHSPGNTFIRDLAAGETILIRPAALLYRDTSVDCHLHFEYPQASMGTHAMGMIANWAGDMARDKVGDMLGGFFSKRINRVGFTYSHRNAWLRLIGPGRVAVQSVYERENDTGRVRRGSYATEYRWGNPLGSIAAEYLS